MNKPYRRDRAKPSDKTKVVLIPKPASYHQIHLTPELSAAQLKRPPTLSLFTIFSILFLTIFSLLLCVCKQESPLSPFKLGLNDLSS